MILALALPWRGNAAARRLLGPTEHNGVPEPAGTVCRSEIVA